MSRFFLCPECHSSFNEDDLLRDGHAPNCLYCGEKAPCDGPYTKRRLEQERKARQPTPSLTTTADRRCQFCETPQKRVRWYRKWEMWLCSLCKMRMEGKSARAETKCNEPAQWELIVVNYNSTVAKDSACDEHLSSVIFKWRRRLSQPQFSVLPLRRSESLLTSCGRYPSPNP